MLVKSHNQQVRREPGRSAQPEIVERLPHLGRQVPVQLEAARGRVVDDPPEVVRDGEPGTSVTPSASEELMRLLVALISVTSLLAGCGGTDWEERWSDAAGKVVADHVVSTSAPECVDEAVILYVGWPLGTRFDTVDQSRQYVRDPNGTLETLGSLDTDVALPAGTRNTGYHLGDLQLWLGRDARRAAYLVEGTTVERWPRLTEPVGCV